MKDSPLKALRRSITAGAFIVVLACAAVPLLAQQSHEVSIRGFKFEPAVVRIRTGDVVRWINNEKRTSHSILFTGETGLESDRLFPGEAWQRIFNRPGTYSYICGPHPEMTGTVIVTE